MPALAAQALTVTCPTAAGAVLREQLALIVLALLLVVILLVSRSGLAV